jgi:hypothetical protein
MNPTDAWAFSPGLALQRNITYTVQFSQRVGNAIRSHNLSVWLGTAQDDAAMSTQVWSATGLNNTTCETRSATFTVHAAGTYYLGFRCTSAANQAGLTVDDVLVTYTIPASCAMNACTVPPAPGEVAPGASYATAQKWPDKTTHAWPEEPFASTYRLYRGEPEDLPKLLAGVETNACLAYAGGLTSVPAAGTPPAGSFWWYLVTGVNSNGEGTAGPYSGGTRGVSSWGTCP